MPIEVRYFSDPACHWAWSAEPELTRLRWEFAGELAFRPVMIGMARELGPGYSDPESGISPGAAWHFSVTQTWLDFAARSGMPFDARIWRDAPPAGTHPACMGVVAAREQGGEGAAFVLRRLREALFCERRPADSAEAIAQIASERPGPSGGSPASGKPSGGGTFSLERFRVDLTSTATIESFAADMSEASELGLAGEGRAPGSRPAIRFGDEELLRGPVPYEQLREAAIAAGASPVNTTPPDPVTALADPAAAPTGRLATAEIMTLTGRPRPVVEAELWRLATEWRIQPVHAPVATLWQLA